MEDDDYMEHEEWNRMRSEVKGREGKGCTRREEGKEYTLTDTDGVRKLLDVSCRGDIVFFPTFLASFYLGLSNPFQKDII